MPTEGDPQGKVHCPDIDQFSLTLFFELQNYVSVHDGAKL